MLWFWWARLLVLLQSRTFYFYTGLSLAPVPYFLTPVKSSTVDTTKAGTYTIIWTATDSAANEGTAERTVTVTEFVDTVAPVVTLLGDESVIQSFGNYVDAGATAEDDIDGDVTSSIVASPVLNEESDAGTYTVTYTATDAAGNKGTATRDVTINACENVNPITGGCEDSPL